MTLLALCLLRTWDLLEICKSFLYIQSISCISTDYINITIVVLTKFYLQYIKSILKI